MDVQFCPANIRLSCPGSRVDSAVSTKARWEFLNRLESHRSTWSGRYSIPARGGYEGPDLQVACPSAMTADAHEGSLGFRSRSVSSPALERNLRIDEPGKHLLV